MGAIGIAIMAKDSKEERVFDFDIDNYNIETRIASCGRCANNCEIVTVIGLSTINLSKYILIL